MTLLAVVAVDRWTVTIGGIFAVVGALVGLLASPLTSWVQRKERLLADRAQRRERAAMVLGALLEWLDDASPFELTTLTELDADSSGEIEALSNRARGIRRDLYILSAGHPSAKIRDQARDLARDLFWYLSRYKEVEDSRRSLGYQDLLEYVKEHHQRTNRLAEKLGEAIRED